MLIHVCFVFSIYRFGGPVKAFLLRASIVSLLCLPLTAQIQSARVEGTVVDSSKAVIPGAKLALINNKTQVKLDAESDGTGFFTFPTVPPVPSRATAVDARGAAA